MKRTLVAMGIHEGPPRIQEHKLRCFIDLSCLETYMTTIFFWRDLPYWPVLAAIIGSSIYSFSKWVKDDFAMEEEHIIQNLGSLFFLFAYILAYVLLSRKNKQEEEIAKRFEIEQIY